MKKGNYRNCGKYRYYIKEYRSKKRLKSKGWTKDPKKERCLSKFYNKSSGVKKELI